MNGEWKAEKEESDRKSKRQGAVEHPPNWRGPIRAASRLLTPLSSPGRDSPIFMLSAIFPTIFSSPRAIKSHCLSHSPLPATDTSLPSLESPTSPGFGCDNESKKKERSHRQDHGPAGLAHNSPSDRDALAPFHCRPILRPAIVVDTVRAGRCARDRDAVPSTGHPGCLRHHLHSCEHLRRPAVYFACLRGEASWVTRLVDAAGMGM